MIQLPPINPALITYIFSGATTIVDLSGKSLKIMFESRSPFKQPSFRIEDDNSKFGDILYLVNCKLSEENEELNLDFKPGDGGRYMLNLKLTFDTTYILILQKVN